MNTRRTDSYVTAPTYLGLRVAGQVLGPIPPAQAPPPALWGVTPNGAPPSWVPRVLIGGVPVVGHVTLDPARKSDPGIPLARALATWADR